MEAILGVYKYGTDRVVRIEGLDDMSLRDQVFMIGLPNRVLLFVQHIGICTVRSLITN